MLALLLLVQQLVVRTIEDPLNVDPEAIVAQYGSDGHGAHRKRNILDSQVYQQLLTQCLDVKLISLPKAEKVTSG